MTEEQAERLIKSVDELKKQIAYWVFIIIIMLISICCAIILN